MTSEQKVPHCYRSENLSLNDNIEIRLELSDEWDEFISICVKEFNDDHINKKMYPDAEDRHKYLKEYYETKRKTTFRDGQARLALFKVTHPLRPDETKAIGGFAIVFEKNGAKEENLTTGCKGEKSCQQKVGHCYCDSVGAKIVKLCSVLEKPVWYLSALVVLKEYRKYFNPIESLRNGFDAIIKEKAYPISVVIYWCTWYEALAQRFTKAGHRLLCVLKNDRFLEENGVQLFMFTDKIEDKSVENEMEKIFQEI